MDNTGSQVLAAEADDLHNIRSEKRLTAAHIKNKNVSHGPKNFLDLV